MKSVISIAILFIVSTGVAQNLKYGKWQGEIQYTSGTVPFTFEVSPSGTDIPEIIFTNGTERRTVKNAQISRDSILIPLDPFDVTLHAAFTAMSMSGTYNKPYRDASIPFSASFGKPRFAKKSILPSPRIEERWSFTFDPGSPNSDKGVGLFRQAGNQVTGTILTETSDYRYFQGILDNDSIKLSSFDGAHAFMILGKKTGEQWEGKIIFDDNYVRPWEAAYDPDVTLVDPFELVTPEPGTHKPYYDLLGAGSGRNAISPDKYEGKVLIIQVFGTWCPNSLDQTHYLVDWYAKNKEKDIAILASSYEANYSQEYGLERLEKYRGVNQIPYDLVLGGRLSKAAAATPFPFMEKIKAFPTLVILDKQGYARYVHSYFNGPATGDHYKAFDERFNEIIDELLAE